MLQFHRILGNMEFSERESTAKNALAKTRCSYISQAAIEFIRINRRYYNYTAILNRLFEEVSTSIATAYNIACSGGHNTKENFNML